MGTLASAYNRAGGYADGGIVQPLLFDSGGVLPMGTSVVQNNTGAPERLQRVDGGMPDRLTLVIDGHEFNAYLDRRTKGHLDEQARQVMAGVM